MNLFKISFYEVLIETGAEFSVFVNLVKYTNNVCGLSIHN